MSHIKAAEYLLAYDVQITPCCFISLYDYDEVSRLHESKNASHTITAVACLAHMQSLQSYLGTFSPSKTEAEGTKPQLQAVFRLVQAGCIGD